MSPERLWRVRRALGMPTRPRGCLWRLCLGSSMGDASGDGEEGGDGGGVEVKTEMKMSWGRRHRSDDGR